MEIIFSTFNARYSHTALALRCLRANLGSLRESSAILEFESSIAPQTAAEKILLHKPKLVLFSVYIWNINICTQTAITLRQVRPDLKIIIGGPEVSYQYEDLLIYKNADHLICGEGENVIEKVCKDLIADKTLPKIIESTPADLNKVALPYNEYTDNDLANRRLYVESSRGCPFKCEYCLSSTENNLRFVPKERLLPEFEKLIERGGRVFKFLDRSFNINTEHATKVLRFFLNNQKEDMMLHLEWEPDRLPKELLQLLKEAPAGFIQLEVGVQTFNEDVAKRIARKLNPEIVEKNIKILSSLPSTHLHTDLIAGLPGETLSSIAQGFDRLHNCKPDEIQLGILKKLRGTPIERHDQNFEMVYNTSPPYDVLQTSTLSFETLQRIRRFARFWNICVNNGRFPFTAPLIWKNQNSVFAAFVQWSDWLYEKTHATAGFTPGRLSRFLEEFLTKKRELNPQLVKEYIEKDLSRKSHAVKGMERQSRSTQ